MNFTENGHSLSRSLPGRSISKPDDPRVTQALKEYIAALEAGARPDRAEFEAQHPEVAEELAVYLDGLEFIRDAAPRMQLSTGEGTKSHGTVLEVQLEGQIGDYRLVREVGRGGMGVVYEAMQVSLGRRVALKVLPLTAALDARQLQRFKNEAQAAAHLHHPNIVPVHAVGNEGSVHYYAMQFIEGRTLAAMIQELRHQTGKKPGGSTVEEESGSITYDQRFPGEEAKAPAGSNGEARNDTKPTDPSSFVLRPSSAFFRAATRLAIQAAEALEHAHQCGIIHRDIKPANLLVDERGNLWVTDFGLARLQDDASLTTSGDLIGTLRYMSPEQAMGRHRLLDHRADIYSLGATLYELLTQEPLFDGRDKQDLLRQIAFEEPRAPRRVNHNIPRDLETILLKAIAKEPDCRYASAEDLAADLRRFLQDEPIQARRPTILQKTVKWARRHKAVVGSTTAVTFFGLLASAFLLWNARNQTEAERKRAEARSELALQAVDDMYVKAQTWLAYEPQMDDLQKSFLKRALRIYREIAKDLGDDPPSKRKKANTFHRIGDIHTRMSNIVPVDNAMAAEKAQHTASASDAFAKAIALYKELSEAEPTNPAYREELASCQVDLSRLQFTAGQVREAEANLRQPLQQLEQLVAEDRPPHKYRYRQKLAECYFNLASLLNFEGKPLVVVPAGMRNASAAEKTKRWQEADQYISRAISMYKDLMAQTPGSAEYANQLASAYRTRAQLLASMGRGQEAEVAYSQAIALLKDLKDNSQIQPDHRHELGLTYYDLGRLLQARRPADAENNFQLAKVLFDKLVEKHPQVPRYHGYLGNTLLQLATFCNGRGELLQARALGERAIHHQKLAARVSPTNWGYVGFLR